MSMLRVRGIVKRFGGVVALRGADLSVEKGSVCALLGANGSGKTTLSRIISGMYKADAGEMFFDGQVVVADSVKKARELGIVMAHQNLSLVDEMTVWENICLGIEHMKGVFVNNAASISYAEEILNLFCIANLSREKVNELSPSQKQLVEVCKAVATKPKLLILDEPTAALEHMQVKQLFDVIHKLRDSGVSIILISHRMNEIMQICDTVAILRNGETVCTLDLEAINEEDRHKIILNAITGKEFEHASSSRAKSSVGEELIRLEGVELKGKLHDISFELRAGEIVGISGLSGMGQEELMLLLSGFLQKTAGQIYYKQAKTKWRSPKQAIKSGVVLVPGDRHKEGLYLTYSVFENLFFPLFAKRGASFLINKKRLYESAKSLMDMISLIPRNADAKLNTLSGGNQQKVVLGKWLHQSPEVLLMSDPAKGIDVEARSELYEICKTFVDSQRGIIIYASDNNELIGLCDRVYVMFEGKIVSCIEKEDLSDAKLIDAALHTHRS